MKGKHVILGVSGGIAAYKTPDLVRQLKASGAEVRCIMTANAQQFVAPLALQTVSQNKVYTEQFEPLGVWNPEHVALADWADLMLVAPATANIIGKFASGIADDLLSTSFLAFAKQVVIAPAMNDKMFAHPIVQRNIETLRQIGVLFIDPTEGELACGTVGKGRMEQPANIVEFIKKLL